MGSFGWRRFFFRIVRKTKSPGCVRVGEETLDSDAILVTRCLAGDDSAFNMLVGRWSRYAGAVALGVTGDHHDAADVVQESFLKAYRKLEDLKDPSSFKSWLRHIVRSTALDRLRRNKTTVALDAKETEGLEPMEDRPGPRDMLQNAELRAAVRDRINALPPAMREVLTLKYLDDRSYEEIAELTGSSVSSVESRLHRARMKLRDAFRGRRPDQL